MKKQTLIITACLVLLALVSPICAEEVTVFAAASLTDSLKEIAANYERQSSDKIVFNFDASSTLARQIERKAPITLNKSYAGWREMAKTDPTMARSFGFKDNAKKEGQQMLELTVKDTVPVWMPGQSMRARTRR